MAKYCWRHATWRKYGECPGCIKRKARKIVKGAPRVAGHPSQWHPIAQRMRDLLAHPENLQQNPFGVCGMAAAVYALIQYTNVPHHRAKDLFRATFAGFIPQFKGSEFPTPHGPKSIDFEYIVRRYQQHLTMLVGAPMPAHFVDFCICRGLGYLLKKMAPGRYEGDKAEFSKMFSTSNPRDYRGLTRYGNLALRTNNLAFILIDILGATVNEIACKNTPDAMPAQARAPAVASVANTTTFNDYAALRDRLIFNAAPGHFAIAAIFSDLQQTGIISNNSQGVPVGRDPNLKFTHWVVIDQVNQVAIGGVDHLSMRVWSWGRYDTPIVAQGNLLSYIQDIIFGHF